MYKKIKKLNSLIIFLYLKKINPVFKYILTKQKLYIILFSLRREINNKVVNMLCYAFKYKA